MPRAGADVTVWEGNNIWARVPSPHGGCRALCCRVPTQTEHLKPRLAVAQVNFLLHTHSQNTHAHACPVWVARCILDVAGGGDPWMVDLSYSDHWVYLCCSCPAPWVSVVGLQCPSLNNWYTKWKTYTHITHRHTSSPTLTHTTCISTDTFVAVSYL